MQYSLPLAPHLTHIANTLAEAVEKKDRVTSGHAKRTAHYALRIARALGCMSEPALERIRLSALLHDVGKIGTPDAILGKGAPLEDGEWGTMREHPRLGSEILGRAPELEEIAGGVRSHHERWDGKGYPEGLSGSQIPWLARLIAIADAYDAMVSTRPYRKGMCAKLAYQEILRGSGTQFDPVLVEAFAQAFTPDIALR